jgi:hypothetical protein
MNRLTLFAIVVAAGCSSRGGANPDDATQNAATTPTPGTQTACTARDLVPPAENFFADISDASRIRKGNFVANPTTPIPINDHSRLAFADLDGDGRDDIVAHSLFPNPQKGIPFEHLVYLNNGDKTFRDFSDESGLRGVQAAFFVFGDVDNDGDQDCFAGLDIALSGQSSALYLNDGKGHFTKKQGSGLEKAELAANGVFGDFNGDARLDLYVGNGGTTEAAPDQLFFGNGDGTFSDVSQKLKNRPSQPTNGVVACDYDNDGDLDLFVSHYGVSIGSDGARSGRTTAQACSPTSRRSAGSTRSQRAIHGSTALAKARRRSPAILRPTSARTASASTARTSMATARWISGWRPSLIPSTRTSHASGAIRRCCSSTKARPAASRS